MERKVNELDCETIFVLQFLDTPGDEVAPGSDEIGKDFQYERLRHGDLLLPTVQGSKFKVQCSNPSSCFKMFQMFQSFNDWENATTDSTVVGRRMSKGKFACHEAVS
jgi:hypothetical protein